MRGSLVSLTLAMLIAGLLALQVTTPWRGTGTRAESARPVPANTLPPHLELGVTVQSLARNSHDPWDKDDLVEVNAFEQDAQRHAGIVMWFADWAHVADFDERQAAAVAARGSIPEISWEPWDANAGVHQPRYRLARIIRGDHDTHIRRWARQIAAYGGPVRLRFAHEMNGRSYPWAERANGNRRGEFAAAWRRVHRIFAAAGARNAVWVWSPVAGQVDRGLYPGARQVDVIGVSGFISEASVFSARWRSFARAFGRPLDDLHRIGPSKPVELSEIGVAGNEGRKAAWIRGMFEEIERRPYIRWLVWFNLRKEDDWRISSSGRAQAAFANGLSARSAGGR